MAQKTPDQVNDDFKLIRNATRLLVDAMSVLPIPTPSGSVIEFLTRLEGSRVERARDILFEQLSLAQITPAQAATADDVTDVIYQYLKSAKNGAALKNIELLARIITGLSFLGKLDGNNFRKFKNAVAELTYEQIHFLGIYIKCWRVWIEESGIVRESEDFLTGTQYNKHQEIYHVFKREMGISHFERQQILAQLSGFGFFIPQEAGIAGEGSVNYLGSYFLLELMDLLNNATSSPVE